MKNPLQKLREARARLYDATIGKRIIELPLETQVEIARRASFGNVELTRRNLLEQLPNDVRDYANKGMTRDQIKAYYWDCKPFKDWWTLLWKQLDDPKGFFEATVDNALCEPAMRS